MTTVTQLRLGEVFAELVEALWRREFLKATGRLGESPDPELVKEKLAKSFGEFMKDGRLERDLTPDEDSDPVEELREGKNACYAALGDMVAALTMAAVQQGILRALDYLKQPVGNKLRDMASDKPTSGNIFEQALRR